ncbi:MAG: hypothetical protein ACFE85_11780 [Candidatus Hodarchaeota archaeon]
MTKKFMNDIPDNLKEQINVAAYYLSQKNHPYDTLCWMLAERQLYIQNNFRQAKIENIRKKAADIYFSMPSYDVLCWLIAELDALLRNKSFKNKPYFF